jgi:dTDP-4-amino-4,6-dideoxygalactose transaminase
MSETGPSKIQVVHIDREYAELRGAIDRAALGVLAGGRYILGPEVTALERELEKYIGCAHAIGCANGTDALILALRALDIGVGDEVVVPSFTFAATAEAVALVGATPVFADIDLATFHLDVASAAALITPRTKAILPVHLFGECVPAEPLGALAKKNGLAVVEDAAQAIGADTRGVRAGALGTIAAFSFYPTKNLGAPGDGGLVTTNDPKLAERVRLIRAHGAKRTYEHELVGLNSRLDEIHAAILRVKLPHLDAWNATRRRHAAILRDAMKGTRATAPTALAGGTHIYHHFTIRVPDRDRAIEHLNARDVGWAIYYPRALHEQPAFAQWGRGPGSLPNAERAAREVLSVPVGPWLTQPEVERVAEALASL